MIAIGLFGGKEIDVSPKNKRAWGSGCDGCPLATARYVTPARMIAPVGDTPYLLWFGYPSPDEAEARTPFVGDAGRFLKEQLRTAGISLTDCGVQWAVRCLPHEKGADAEPSPRVLHHCNAHTKNALQHVRPTTVHIIFGEVAAAAALGNEYQKSRPVFFSSKLGGMVVCVERHQRIRHYPFDSKEGKRWRRRLKAAAEMRGQSSRFDVLKRMNYALAKTVAAVERRIDNLEKCAVAGKRRVSVDIEVGRVKDGVADVTGDEKLLTIAFSVKRGVAFTVPLEHPESPFHGSRLRRVLARVRKFLENRKVKVTCHHGSTDVGELARLGNIHVAGYDFDSNYSSYLDDPDQKKYGLDFISMQWFPRFAEYKHIVRPYAERHGGNYAGVPLRVLWRYNAADADIGKRAERLTARQAGPLLATYMDAAFIVDKMQETGPKVDMPHLDSLKRLIPPRLDKLNQRLAVLAGDPEPNLGNSEYVAGILYDKLGLPTVGAESAEKKGKNPRGTGKDILKELALLPKGEFPRLLLEKRQLDKISGTYINNYEIAAKRFNGEIRTKWWLTGTVTGRLRSGGDKDEDNTGILNMQNLHGDPTLLNVLVSSPFWRRLYDYSSKRAARVLRRMMVFAGCDYSQVELRVLAELSGDELLISQFLSGRDLHCQVGNTVLGLDERIVATDKAIRRGVKAVSFGIVYGLGVEGLYRKMTSEGMKGLTVKKVQRILDTFFDRYKGVARWIERQKQQAKKNGWVESLFGFRRPIITGEYGEEDDRGTFWGNQAVNTPVQSSAHTLLLIAMALLKRYPERYPLLRRPLAEIHDAFIFWSRLENAIATVRQLKRLLEVDVKKACKDWFGVELRVPLVAEASCGFRLGAMLEEEDYKDAYADTPAFVKGWKRYNDEVEKKSFDKWGTPQMATAV